MAFAIRINSLKVSASEALVEIVQGAMLVAGSPATAQARR